MNFQEVLNTVKAGDSDYVLAQKLGVKRQTVSNWRNGRRTPEDSLLDKMVEMSTLTVQQVYLAAYAEKTENLKAREVFRTLAS
jgi:transcriptional regulator with XRE-family HTH domain